MKNIIHETNRVRILTNLALSIVLFTASHGVDILPSFAQTKTQRITQKVNQLKGTERKWIQVSLSRQRLIAWQGSVPVYGFTVSTGKKKTPTLTGIFNIQSKHRQARMRGEGYDIPNVPHIMYYDGSYGIHGAFWHHNFGTPMSRGCVNLRPHQAKTLFNWANIGTPVIVQN